PGGGEAVAVAFAGVGPVMPGVVAGIALVVEPAIVARHLRIVATVGGDRVQAVVALVGGADALGDAHADDRGRINAEALHALAVGAHVGLADQNRLHPERTQIVAERQLAHFQRVAVPRRAVRLHIAPGVEAHARGATHRRLHVGS